MLAKKDVLSSNGAGTSGKGGFRRPYPRKPTEVLNEREFHDHFYFLNGVSIQLVDGDAMSTARRKKSEKIDEISPIYRVSAGGETTHGGDKSAGRFFAKNRQKIGDISLIYRRHRINRRFYEKIA